ncbi:MAG: hypothetical protein P1P63_00610 [Treponemataceae bacterium]
MEKIFIKKYLKEIIAAVFFITIIILQLVILSNQKEWKLKHDLLDSKLDKAIEKLAKQNNSINRLAELISEQTLRVSSSDKESLKLKELLEALSTDGKNAKSSGNNTVTVLYKESELLDKEKAAYKLYKAGKYAQAYKIYDEIRELDPSRIKSRYYWVCSRYYSNPMDVGSFAEILEEIQYLRSKGIIKPELSEIESGMKAEQNILKGE